MAQGDVRVSSEVVSSAPGTGVSCPARTVAVGDLVFAAYTWRSTAVTPTISSDINNSWNSLTAYTAGSNESIYWAWTIATAAGSMTVSFTHSSDNSDAVGHMLAIEGPFLSSPLDKQTGFNNDATSAYTSNATGVLTQADEIIIGAIVHTNGLATYSTSGGSTVVTQGSTGTGANTASGAVFIQIVSATTSTTIAVAGSASSACTIGAASFMFDVGGGAEPYISLNFRAPGRYAPFKPGVVTRVRH